MIGVAHARRYLIWLAIALVLLAAFTPAASVLFFAILAPVWLFIANTVAVSLSFSSDRCQLEFLPFYSALSSRPPPLAS